MKIKKIIALLLATVLTVGLMGCKKDSGQPDGSGGQNTPDNSKSINLLYCSNDTFNPYTLITKVNSELCQLLFDPLVKLDNNFEPIYTLAHSASRDKNVWTVVLKDAVFSDNSIVRGEDVLYSFNLAKNHASYSSSLSHVTSAKSEGAKIIFTLSYEDPYFINLLDFPILKAGSDNLKNEDSVLFPPIGAGRYILSDDHTYLIKNENYYSTAPKFSKINLINAPDSESVAHYVEVGATDFYYANINDGTIFRMDGKKYSVNQNRLIYLGVNFKNPVLKNTKMRYGISAAINRQKIVSDAYYSNAVAANGPFTPVWKETKSYQTLETTANTKISIENLEQIGYNILDNLGQRKNSSGSPLVFSLLINKENTSQVLCANLIKSQLFEVGIKININALSYKDYLSALKSGSFQLYLA